MSFLIKDEAYAFEALRTAGAGVYSGGDIGEIAATMRGIRAGDDASWLRAWTATADRVTAIAESADRAGRRVSAREAYLRASNYYRNAEFFQRVSPSSDAEVLRLSRLSRQTFEHAIALFDTPATKISIPYEGTELPGYLFLVDDQPVPRPTVIYTNGYDSTAEESWFAIAAAAIRRGYNVLAYDGPGQGAVIREQGLKFRPDWEAVLGPVVDYAVGHPAVDGNAIVHFGYSFGAFLVARTAVTDHRAAALILDDGYLDWHQVYTEAIPAPVMRLINRGRDRIPNLVLGLVTRSHTTKRWGLNHGRWTVGGASYAEFVRHTRAYSLTDTAHLIKTPTLILDAEEDHFSAGQPEALAKAMTAPTTLARFTSSEGAGEHCHVGALSLAHQRMFDWLGETLPQG
ncbi:alpha/beta hydrolase family protein [Streptomyces sp. enrichment culture]|uniref:alpha/beta hydrolase family protein n=1 Tax=Streptomyces sp. enrichment culture TaxID=1795815 RepID=UPI003F571EBC